MHKLFFFVRKMLQNSNLGLKVHATLSSFIEYPDIDRRDTILYYNPRTKRFLRANISNVKLCI